MGRQTILQAQSRVAAVGQQQFHTRASGKKDLLRSWLALGALATLIRLPQLLYSRPIDDEAVYSVVARVMLAGGQPYRDAIERKPPLLFEVYHFTLKLFGPANWLALHFVSLVWVLLTMAALYALAANLFDRRAGVLAALGYAIFQPWATAKDLAFNGEVLMNLPLAVAYALAARADHRALWRPFASGALCAVAFLLKQPAAIAAVPLALYFLMKDWPPSRSSFSRQGLRDAATMTAGFGAVLLTTGAVLWRNGLLGEAWYWTVLDHDIPHIFWMHGLLHTLLFSVIALPLLLPLTRPSHVAAAWRGREAQLRLIFGWAVVSIIGLSAGGRFYPHYYIQLVPPLVILVAPFYAHAASGASAAKLWLRFAAGWCTLVCVVTLAVQSHQLFHANPPSAAGIWLRKHSAETDRVFVWGQATPIYLDADRLPASRYIATFPLTGYVFGGPIPGLSTRDRIVPGSWQNLVADFARHPPAWIVDTQASGDAPYPIRAFPAFSAILHHDYQRAATVSGAVIYRRITLPDNSAGTARLRNNPK